MFPFKANPLQPNNQQLASESCLCRSSVQARMGHASGWFSIYGVGGQGGRMCLCSPTTAKGGFASRCPVPDHVGTLSPLESGG